MPETATRKKAGWTTVAFGDVVQLCKERSSDPEADGYERFIGLEHIDPGELRVRRWGDIADGVTFTNVFHPGQVLFGKRRAYQRKVAVADFSGVCSGDIYVLEPKGDALLPELLPFICQTDAFFEHAVGTSAGSLSPRTNWKSLADFEFALPPIDKQQQILHVLTASLGVYESFRSVSDRLLKLRRATQDRLLFPKTSNNSRNSIHMHDIAEINPQEPPLAEDAFFYPMDAVDEWERVISRHEVRGTRGGVRAKGNDILMARITPCLENGKIAQVPSHVERCGGSTEFIVLRAKPGVSTSYLYWLVTSERVRNASIAMMYGSTARQRASGNDVRDISVPQMTAIEKQEAGDLIDTIEESRKHAASRSDNAKHVHFRLVNKLLGGRGA